MASKEISYTYHHNSRVAKYFAELRGGTYIGYVDDIKHTIGINKEGRKEEDNIKHTSQGAYVVRYESNTLLGGE